MPKTLTIHDLAAPTAERLATYASREGKSLNQSVKDLLASALGVTARSRVTFDNGLARFRGSVAPKDADLLLRFVEQADFSQIDVGDL